VSLGQKLKEYRLKAGKSQKELADLLGVSRATLASWETGRRKPDYEILRNIAAIFNCSVDVLIEAETTVEDPFDDEDLTMMFYDVKELPPEDREVIKNMIVLLKTKADALSKKNSPSRRHRKETD